VSLQNIMTLITVIMIIWQVISLKKPFKVSRFSIIRSVVSTPIIMVVYALMLGATIMRPAGFYLLGFGFMVGLFYGILTKVYKQDLIVMAKRSVVYIVVWGLIYIFTHTIGRLLGTGGITLGLTLMMFTLGILISQYGILSWKAIHQYGLIKQEKYGNIEEKAV